MPNAIKKGGKLFISSADVSADLDQAGYEALTWVEITGKVSFPEMGISANMVSRDLIEDDITDFQKGFATAGQSDFEVAPDHSDLGQVELLEAGAAAYRFKRGFKIEHNDKLTSGGTNTIRYSRGLVSGPRLNGGSGEDFDTETYSVAFTQEPIIVEAT